MKRILGAPRVGVGPVVLILALCVLAAAVSNKAFNASSFLPEALLARWTGPEHEGREVYDRRVQIVDAVGLAPGMTVADIGTGTGLFARLFARRVGPTGRVYATDISRWAVFKTAVLARAEHLGNVVGVVGDEDDAGLAAGSLDVAFVCDAYHHFDRPRPMLQSIYRALKPGGRVVLVDYDRVPGESEQWILDHVPARFDRPSVLKDFEEAGFRLVDEETFLDENYLLVFQRQ